MPLLFKPRWDYEDKYEKKNEKDVGRNSKMTPYDVCVLSYQLLN